MRRGGIIQVIRERFCDESASWSLYNFELRFLKDRALMKLMKVFTEHPESIGETYFEHAQHAAGFGSSMLLGALASFAHAVVPAVFVTTGSRIVTGLHQRMVLSRVKRKVGNGAMPLTFLAEHI